MTSAPGFRRIYEVCLSGGRRMTLALAPPPALRLLRSEAAVDRVRGGRHWMAHRTAVAERIPLGGATIQRDTARRLPLPIGSPPSPSEELRGRHVAAVDLLQVCRRWWLRSRQSIRWAASHIFDLQAGTPISALVSLFHHGNAGASTYSRAPLPAKCLCCLQDQEDLDQLCKSSPRWPFPALEDHHQAMRQALSMQKREEVVQRNGPCIPLSPREHPPRRRGHAVVLPYLAIRRHFKHLGYILDMVSLPRLVLVDAVADSNLLVLRSKTVSGSSGLGPVMADGSARDLMAPAEPSIEGEHCSSEDGGHDEASESVTSSLEEEDVRPVVMVTGLRDWGNCVFGDPLFASVFCEEPSEHFLRGFDGPEGGRDPAAAAAGCDDAIEDRESVPVRSLLYQCYHTTVQIVTEFYRPTSESTSRELAARKS